MDFVTKKIRNDEQYQLHFIMVLFLHAVLPFTLQYTLFPKILAGNSTVSTLETFLIFYPPLSMTPFFTLLLVLEIKLYNPRSSED